MVLYFYKVVFFEVCSSESEPHTVYTLQLVDVSIGSLSSLPLSLIFLSCSLCIDFKIHAQLSACREKA